MINRFLLAGIGQEELGLLLTYSIYQGNVKDLLMILDEVTMRRFLIE